MEDYSEDYIIVYTLPQLCEQLRAEKAKGENASQELRKSIEDYMKNNPDGFGTMEREDKDLDYNVIIFENSRKDRVYAVRDVYKPDALINMVEINERARPASSTKDSINAAVYQNNEKVKEEQSKKAGMLEKIRRMFTRQKDDVVAKEMEVRNKWQDYLREKGIKPKVSISAAKLNEADIELKKFKTADNKDKQKTNNKDRDLERKYKEFCRQKRLDELTGAKGIIIPKAHERLSLTEEEKRLFEEIEKNKNKRPVKQTTITGELIEALRERQNRDPGHTNRPYYPPAADS